LDAFAIPSISRSQPTESNDLSFQTMIPPGTELARRDVIGRRIVSIVQSGTMNDAKGMDWAYTFFYLDSGAVFCLPCEDAGGFLVELPPDGSQPLEDPQFDFVLGQQIVQVLRDGPETQICEDSPCLVLENGFLVTDVMGAPHGLGAVGVYLYEPDEVDISKMTDFFTD
jgi:hypothetical protein